MCLTQCYQGSFQSLVEKICSSLSLRCKGRGGLIVIDAIQKQAGFAFNTEKMPWVGKALVRDTIIAFISIHIQGCGWQRLG